MLHRAIAHRNASLRLRILDIDGSLPRQAGIAEALSARRAQCIDLRAEEQRLRLWTSRRRLRDLAVRLQACPAPPGTGPLATFYGSGDYHHLATTLIAASAEPLTVIHFDNHPDWVRAPAANNCGGWVNRVLELSQVARVVTLGICSDDLVRPQWKGGNLAALASGRLEIHPWRAPPSRVWGGIGDGHGRTRSGDHLVWHCLADLDWDAFLDALLLRLPTEAVWVTIDKDVLRAQDATSNWDQGQMPLEALVTGLRTIAARRRIAGVDVCGEYSPPRFSDPLKRVAAWLDHPAAFHPDEAALLRNDRTNRVLIETLAQILP